MKTQTKVTTVRNWKNMLVLLFSAVTMMACSKNSGNNANNSAVPGFAGLAGCTACGGFGQGPLIFQGTARDPNGVFQMTSLQVMADAAGYQAVAQQGLRPSVNGTYPTAVGGMFHLNYPISCQSGITYPPGDYNIQMLQIGQTQNGVFYAPSVALVGPVTIQPAAVAAVWVDPNLDNAVDPGSLFRVGFCGQWFDMNTCRVDQNGREVCQ